MKPYVSGGMMKMAIDYTEKPHYGKIDRNVIRGKYKSGTDKFQIFTTICVVGKDEGMKNNSNRPMSFSTNLTGSM
ncbi:MAG: hypothetical protein QXQ39_05160 [Conexivisphaerales archaeon]